MRKRKKSEHDIFLILETLMKDFHAKEIKDLIDGTSLDKERVYQLIYDKLYSRKEKATGGWWKKIVLRIEEITPLHQNLIDVYFYENGFRKKYVLNGRPKKKNPKIFINKTGVEVYKKMGGKRDLITFENISKEQYDKLSQALPSGTKVIAEFKRKNE